MQKLLANGKAPVRDGRWNYWTTKPQLFLPDHKLHRQDL